MVKVIPDISKIKSVVNDYFTNKSVEKAYLFGSFSRNQQQEKSDIDILVELDESVGLMQLIKYKQDLEDILHCRVDLLTRQAISSKIRPYIEKEMKIIYERKG